MNEINLTFSNISIIVSAVLRVITAIIFVAFIIPLQVKQVGVKNGLRSLRRAFLIVGLLLLFISTVGLMIILTKPFFDQRTNRFIADTIAIFNSAGFLIVALVLLQIYRGQFTPKNIRLHAKVEKQELKDAQNLTKKVKKS